MTIGRREFGYRLVGVGTGTALAGCSGVDGGGESTPTVEGVTPEYRPLELEVVNSTDTELDVTVRMTTAEGPGAGTVTAGGTVYEESVTLSPGERLDLQPHRVRSHVDLTVSVGSEVVYRDLLDPQEGHTIRIVSETEVEVETVVV